MAAFGKAGINTATRTPSPKRFDIIGGPRGELSCRPTGCPTLSDR